MIKQLTLGTKVTLSVWFFMPKPPPKDDWGFRIVHLLWGDGCDWDLAFTLYVTAGRGLVMGPSTYDKNINMGCGPIAYVDRAALPAADLFTPVWHHFVSTMDVSKRVRHVEATIDGRAIPSVDVSSMRDSVPTTAQLSVGFPCINQTSGCLTWDGEDYEVLIDDVSVTTAN